MNEYKIRFEREHGIKWEYQNERLVQRYITFKRSRQALSKNLERPIPAANELELSQISESIEKVKPSKAEKRQTTIPRENKDY